MVSFIGSYAEVKSAFQKSSVYRTKMLTAMAKPARSEPTVSETPAYRFQDLTMIRVREEIFSPDG